MLGRVLRKSCVELPHRGEDTVDEGVADGTEDVKNRDTFI